jgi:hypothetical protein
MAAEISVHLWVGGRDKGRVSCQLDSWAAAERWIAEWKSVAPTFENDDLRINDSRCIDQKQIKVGINEVISTSATA